MSYQLLAKVSRLNEQAVFEEFTSYFNCAWFMQTLIVVIHCLLYGRINPTHASKKDASWPVKQFNCMLLCHSLVYIIEFGLTDICQARFSDFLHHLIAIGIFVLTIYESNVISVVYLMPYLLHSFYWSLPFDFKYDHYVLYAYNFSLFWSYYSVASKLNKLISVRICFLCVVLLQINIFAYVHHVELNLFEIDSRRLLKGLVFSCLFSAPAYIHLLVCYNLTEFRLAIFKKALLF